MATFNVLITNPNLSEIGETLNCTAEFVEFPRRIECITDEGGGNGTSGTGSAFPCQTGCGERAFFYITEPGDTISLQFNLADVVNEEPEFPEYGWRENSDAWWLSLQVFSPSDALLWEGNTADISDAYSTGATDAGPFQNVVINVDRLIPHLQGNTCFYFRLAVRGGAPAPSGVDAIGSWDGNPPYMDIGTIVINTHQDHFGIWELIGTGWVFLRWPTDGELFWVAGVGQWMQYSANSVIYTARGGSEFSFSRGSLTGEFEETDSYSLVDMPGSAIGCSIESMVLLRGTNDKIVATGTSHSRWNDAGSGPSGNALFVSEDGADYDPAPVNEAEWYWPSTDLGAQAVLVDKASAWVEVRGPEGENRVGHTVHDTGYTSAFDVIPMAERAISVVHFDADGVTCVITESGAIRYTANGGTNWLGSAGPGTGPGLIASIGGDRIIAISFATNVYAIHENKGNPAQPWGPVQSLPFGFGSLYPMSVIAQGANLWIFGAHRGSRPGGAPVVYGLGFRSRDGGASWEYIDGSRDLGGRASAIGTNAIVATSFVHRSDFPGDGLTNGTVYVTTDGGDTWQELPHQPDGGAEAVAGRLLPGEFTPVDRPGADPEGEAMVYIYTMSYRMRRCNESVVHVQSTDSGRDCLGYIHDTPTSSQWVGAGQVRAFQHDFKLAGSIELEALPVTRELSENGRPIRTSTQAVGRLRLAPLPEGVARILQAVTAAPVFMLNGTEWSEIEEIRKNNETGTHWHINSTVRRDECETTAPC